MYKPILIFAIVTCLFVEVATAQKITGCGFKIPPRSVLRSNFQSVYEAQSILKNMLDSIQWKENFNIREQNGIQNAYATIINNVRWIVYDNTFLENIDSYTSSKWSSISVLAHEMGHHYYNHVVNSTGSAPPKEIEADAFSGFVMQRLGASMQQSIAAMQAIASDQASSSHPAKKDRVDAIMRGWNAASASVARNTPATVPANNPGNQGPATNPVPTRQPVPGPVANPGNPSNPSTSPVPNTDPATDPSWIALSIQSNKDETVSLSDDGRQFQNAEIKAGQPFVFKFEIYNYGWLRLKYYNGYRNYKLLHGKDYMILWNRRTSNWTVTEIPE